MGQEAEWHANDRFCSKHLLKDKLHEVANAYKHTRNLTCEFVTSLQQDAGGRIICPAGNGLLDIPGSLCRILNVRYKKDRWMAPNNFQKANPLTSVHWCIIPAWDFGAGHLVLTCSCCSCTEQEGIIYAYSLCALVLIKQEATSCCVFFFFFGRW